MTFRNHLPREAILASVGPLVDLLRSPSPVVHSYAANALDKILILKNAEGSSGGALIKAADLAGLEQKLLVNLFHAMTIPGSEVCAIGCLFLLIILIHFLLLHRRTNTS